MEVNLEALPIGEDAPEMVNLVVEVPVGSRIKYEYEPELGAVLLDRVLPGNIRYPVAYGFVPSTESVDGEPLDAVMASYEPTFPGCVVKARVIGVLDIGGDSGSEPNLFAVPQGDPRFDDIGSLEDIPEQNLREIENFFVTFKQLEGDEEVQIEGWRGLEGAQEVVRECAR